MRRGLVIAAILLALTGVALFYFLALPGMLSSSYRERAEPADHSIATSLNQVYGTY